MEIVERGVGSPVLIMGCHGPGGTWGLDALTAALSREHRVLLPDLPGYGATPPLAGRYTFEAVTVALEAMLRERGATRLSIVGFSLGAYRAFALALRGSLEVTSLVALGGFAGLDADVRAQYGAFAGLVRSDADLRPVARERFLSARHRSAHPDDTETVMATVAACPRDVLAGELDALADAPDLRPLVAGLQAPLLARVGTEDIVTPPAWSEALVAAAPRARLELVPGAGHGLLFEDREATCAAVAQAVRAPA